MLKIYGANLSAPANKVRFVANALGLEYEYKQVRIRDGEHRSEEYLKLNPVGKVPIIDDDGFVLFESDAICKYLCRKHNSPFYPNDLKQQAVVDQWVDFVTIHVGGAMGRVLFNRIFAPAIGTPVDENSLRDGLKFLDRFLPVLDNQLGKNKYVAGNSLTLADFDFLAQLDPFEAGQVELSPYKNIVRLRSDLMQQDYYTKCHKSYGEALKQMMAMMKK